LLSFIFAAKYPKLIKKLVLVSSGPFEEKYSAKIMKTRLNRLNEKEKTDFNAIIKELNTTLSVKKNKLMSKLGKLISKADSYSPLRKNNKVECNYDIYESVWKEAEKLRESRKLIRYAKKVKCPVVAIHGDYDPHPYQGVKILSEKIKDFKFILLKKCGHTPWLEKYAKESFYKTLKKEINQ
jgi:pimeloyl-ACP methyl ester carboxylesterase